MTRLEIATRTDPAALIAALEAAGAHALDAPRARDAVWRVSFESHAAADPESTAIALLDSIALLTGKAKQAWTACTLRELHLGLAPPSVLSIALSAATLTRVAKAGLSVRVTLAR